MITCPLCQHQATELTILKPYLDRDWQFPVADCPHCQTRFAERDKTINYHELLHEAGGGHYDHHEQFAKEVQKLLQNEQVAACEQLFRKRGFIWSHLIDTIKKFPKTAKILEVGCSLGYASALIQQLGYRVQGIDISETAVQKARAYFGDFFSTKIDPNETFDCIFHIGLIGCTDNPKMFLAEYLPHITENGVMFFNAPDLRALWQHQLPWGSTPPPDLIYFFTPESFNSIIDTTHYRYSIETKIDPVLYAHALLRKKQLYQPQRLFVKKESGPQATSSTLKRQILYVLGWLLQKILRRKVFHQYGLFVSIHRKQT